MRAVMAGVAGVGKSTVLGIVSKKIQYDVVNYGTLMFEMAKELNLVADRDQIRKLSVDTQINLQKKASSIIGKMDNVIIDTHMAIRSPKGYLPGLPEWVVRELKVSSYFLIESDPALIKERRSRDDNRKRDSDTVEEIAEHQMVNRYFAVAYSVFTGATIRFVDNPEGKPENPSDIIVQSLVQHD
ncbi:MAG: adenylate kinase [Candidatus Thermoplasmatota archaeon]|jgi:adenylate kinase|nr:adenylate kinase [Candidatus Thermoplasmatota archaeon]MCL5786227.1 adenylate kinase [Candidatus Thermoplasmatota archaeon]